MYKKTLLRNLCAFLEQSTLYNIREIECFRQFIQYAQIIEDVISFRRLSVS
jgi:hypothetical protein